MTLMNKIVGSFMAWILKKFLNNHKIEIVLRENARSNLKEILMDQEIIMQLWSLSNKRPNAPIPDYIYMPSDIQKEMYRIAGEKSARYIMDKHPFARPFMNEESLLRHSVELSLKSAVNGLYLEFGVFTGRTINIISEMTKNFNINVHGFDSFQGLPEDWNNTALKGLFDLNGQFPKVNENVILHAGWFDQSLPDFLKLFNDKVSFLHIDSDLYSSAKTIFTRLKERIVQGTVIQFDEFFNYPAFEEHEFKAFFEFIEETGFSCTCLGYDTSGFAVSFIIK